MVIETNNRLVDEIGREHRHVAMLLAHLRQLLTKEPSYSELTEFLFELHDSLQRHFRFEENGGYFVEALRRDPNQTPRVEALLEEHQRMSKELLAAHAMASARSDINAIKAALTDWINTLVAHERKENALVQETFNAEVGSGD